MTIGQKIKYLRTSLKYTQEELARAANTTKQTIHKYETGIIDNIPASKIKAIADKLNTTPAYLMGWENNSNETNIINLDQNLYYTPVFESVSAGFGTLAVDDIVDYIPLPYKSKAEAEETICIKVKGDSMSPKIEGGDIIQVRKQSSVDSGDIAVVLINGDEGLVKKVEYDADYIKLVSINPYYPPIEFKGSDVLQVMVVGKVKKIIRDL